MSIDNGQELEQFLTEHPQTELLELLIPDMNGMLRGKREPRGEFAKIFAAGVNNCASTTLLDSKGQTFTYVDYGGADGDPDAIGVVVPGSLAPVPWASRPTAQALLTMRERDGAPHFADPRNVLARAVQPLSDMGLTPVVATELEFYLVDDDAGQVLPRAARIPGTGLRQEGAQYATLDDLQEVDPFLHELAEVCRAQNLPAGAALAEYAPGQFEVNLHHVADVALACDHAMLLKRAVKAVARKHGMAATFMAKPFAEYAGSGLHVHLSLLDDRGQNVFAGQSRDGDFSDSLRHAIGGLLQAMSESMAILAPNANSYRRLQPQLYVPMTPNWGINHRSVAVRVPLASGASSRFEYRVASADANPYLVMAAIVAGVHHGLSRRIEPGTPVREGEVLEEEEITLPRYWEAALTAFEKGALLPGYLGEHYHQVFARCRWEERDRFNAAVSDQDYQWYLRGA